MVDASATITAAQQLLPKDEDALLLEVALRDNAISKEKSLGDNPALTVTYDSTHMGLLDDLKALGLRIVNRWNKELYSIACPKKAESDDDKKIREDLMKALNLGDAAIIAAVVTGLLALGAPAAIAAAVAPFLVKKFIIPAKNELCDAWGEAFT